MAARDMVADRILVLADACGLDKSESWRLVTEAWEVFDASLQAKPTPSIADALRDATAKLRSVIELLDRRREIAADSDEGYPVGVDDTAGDGTSTRDGKAADAGQGPAVNEMAAGQALLNGLKLFGLAAAAVAAGLSGWIVPVVQNLLASAITTLAASINDSGGSQPPTASCRST